MKTVTQKDFQDLYQSPSYEQTEEVRRTLANLPDRRKPERRPVIGKRRAAFILAAALVLMGIAAVAVGYYTGTLVSWGGKQTEYTEPETRLSQEEYGSLNEMLNAYPEDVFVAVIQKDGSNTVFKDITRTVHSADELLQVLDTAGYPHPGQVVPDGWVFSSATVNYDSSPDGRYELVSETETADGRYTVQQYKLDERYQAVVSYTVQLEKGSKQGFISSGATTKEYILLTSFAYPADGKVRSKAVSIPGMEDALYTDYEGETMLHMYRPLEKPVAVNGDWTDLLTDGEYVEESDYECITCSNLQPEEIIPLFSGTP